MYLEEGYVKFQSEWEKADPLPETRLTELVEVRQQMVRQNWIGHHEVLQVGFGNISQRTGETEAGVCLISGTQTGHLSVLDPIHITTVEAYDFSRNWLRCRGPIQASSETLTHVAVYEAWQACQGVIHIHDLDLWQRSLHKLPTTDPSVPYGSPEMAAEVLRLFSEDGGLRESGVLVMGGHEEGLIGFGKSLEEAARRLLHLL